MSELSTSHADISKMSPPTNATTFPIACPTGKEMASINSSTTFHNGYFFVKNRAKHSKIRPNG